MAGLAGLRAVIGGMIRSGVSWWLAELAAFIPRRFANRPENASAILEVSNSQSTLVLTDRRRARATRIALGGADWQQDRTRVQSAVSGRQGKAVVVRLDQSLVMDADVTLPLNAERSLRQILLHQLDRLVPLPPDEIEFAYQVTARSAVTKTLTVRLVVATRDSIERAVGLVRSVGLTPSIVIVPTGIAGPDALVPLWRENQERMSSPVQRWLRRGMVAMAIVLLIAAYGTYVHRLTEYRDRLEQDVAAATKASSAARDLVARNAQTENALGLLLRRQKELEPLRLLDELTNLVPVTSWVSQLSVRGRTVELIGYSPKVSDLISRIEDNDIFHNPKFRSPITMSPDGKGERFDVSFDVWVEDAP